MKNIGYLEEIILLLIMSMEGEAYGYSVSEAYKKYMGKSISISEVHTVMTRMEEKGMIKSSMGGATAERGGRRKRIFEATEQGITVISEIKSAREKLWDLIPDLR